MGISKGGTAAIEKERTQSFEGGVSLIWLYKQGSQCDWSEKKRG